MQEDAHRFREGNHQDARKNGLRILGEYMHGRTLLLGESKQTVERQGRCSHK